MQYNGMVKDLILRFQGEKKNQPAFSLYDGEQITNISYEQFAQDILKTANYFLENQITGEHVAIAAPNSYRWIVIFFAVMATGNVAVSLNQELPPEILQWQCKNADVSMVCYSESVLAEKLGEIRKIPFETIVSEKTAQLDYLHTHSEDETILMIYTSGTTGKSKTVMLSAKNLFASANNMFSVEDQIRIDDKRNCVILTLPLFHIGSIRTMLNRLSHLSELAIGRGAKYVFMDMPKLNPTHVGMVPAMAESLAKIMRRSTKEQVLNYVGNDFQTIIAVGASMKPSVAQFLLEKGVQIQILYGMTESAGDGAWCVLDDRHIGTIGKPDGKIDFKIEDGEILIRSDGVMKGYYNDPEETAKVIVDGWLHTGDMGYCDEDGYYYITGRKKNVIILSNGENVNPEEIEATFSECEDIEECLVYSDGKGICADVFASKQEKAEAFIKNYNESMPMYRQVYKVNYTFEPLPKTGSGKIKRKENK